MSGFDFDLFVIGGGSAGVRCGRIAAGLGARVGVAEARFWGGTCVNVGCVPKKLLVQAAEYGGFAADARGFGWQGPLPQHDWASLIAAKNREIARLNGVYKRLLEAAGAEIFEARARFLDPHTLEVGGRRLTAARIVIATGGHPVRLPIPGAEHALISDDVFFLKEMPKRIAIMGSGYIAVEFACIFRGLGAEVFLIYRQPQPLRGFDGDLRAALAEALADAGIRIFPQTRITEISAEGDAKRVRLSQGEALSVDAVLLATGRAPNVEGLGLAEAGVAVDENGAIRIDQEWRTSQPHIYAIGDV
ncbi:MAG: FAD-dependent oxidoreductase, partial [Acidobacteriia bacterium]|nr:FAD-dependent oxidoreductase [Methyloceanibacter sp.]MCL6493083.1 FAD-dependent oxidoreductase [Terriglobia bacterium]